MNDVPKFGTFAWKPISETRKSTITPVFKVECYKCGGETSKYASTYEGAQRLAELHDQTHSFYLAECCMYSGRAACKCGNVLV